MHVDIIDSYADFAALELNWNAIYDKDPEAQFFMSWCWLSRIFTVYPNRWRILAVRSRDDGNSYVCFFAIQLKTVWSRRKKRFRNELHMAGTLFWGQYNGFICDPAWEDQAIPSLAAQLKQLDWSRISLKYLYTSQKRIKLFTGEFPSDQFRLSFQERWINKGKTNNLICPYIELPKTYDDYLQSRLSVKTRQKVRRFTRKFEGSDELYFTVTNEFTLQRDLDIFVELWTEKWIEIKGAKTKLLARKFRIIIENTYACNDLYMPILWQGDSPICVQANFVDRRKGEVFFFVSGRKEGIKIPYVGLLIHANVIRWAIENGFNIYDFCHGNEPYKYSFGAIDRELAHLVVATKSGINLYDRLDPDCIGDVMRKVVQYIENNRLDDAKTGCRQVADLSKIHR